MTVWLLCFQPSGPPAHRFAHPGYWASLSRVCSAGSPIPFRRFAVRYVRGFYLMLPMGAPSPTRHFCLRSCPVGVVLPSGNGGQFYLRNNVPEYRSKCHARHTQDVARSRPVRFLAPWGG
jgi:hypothetical protein